MLFSLFLEWGIVEIALLMGGVILLQAVVFLASLGPVQSALQKNFDKQGNPILHGVPPRV